MKNGKKNEEKCWENFRKIGKSFGSRFVPWEACQRLKNRTLGMRWQLRR